MKSIFDEIKSRLEHTIEEINACIDFGCLSVEEEKKILDVKKQLELIIKQMD